MSADEPDEPVPPPGAPDAPAAGGRARSVGRGVRSAARLTGRGVAGVARGTANAGRYTARQARRASHADGAGESGLWRLIELHAFSAAGDAAVAISLAGTLFFQVPSGEARDQVALFLAVTMLPFAIVAPLIGPFLDRFAHGRRWAIGATLATRGILAFGLATVVNSDSTWLFPAALGCLVASKAYGVTRAAAIPRLVPENLTLVKTNARLSLAGIIGATVSAPIAGLAAMVGPEWSLRYAFVVFVFGTIWAILLPPRVDSSVGEQQMTMRPEVPGQPAADPGKPGKRRTHIPLSVAFALRCNLGPRWLSGFLTIFMAFLLRENPLPGWRPELLAGLVIGAAGAGNAIGVALGSILKRVNPAITVVIALAADLVMAAVTGLFYGVLTLALLGLTAGMAQALAKLSLDSTIQRDVPERVRTSAFARSDTMLQLAWVLGGFVGIAMPLNPELGLGIAAGLLGAWLVFVLVTKRRSVAGPTPATAR